MMMVVLCPGRAQGAPVTLTLILVVGGAVTYNCCVAPLEGRLRQDVAHKMILT